MKTKIVHIATALLLFIAFRGAAQVSVVLFPSPAHQFFIDDIWKTIIISPTGNANVIIQFEIRNSTTTDVVKVTTLPVNLVTGANRLSSAEGTGARWDYGNTSASTILQSTGKLPYGQYTFCISVLDPVTNKMLGSNCDERDIQPMLPPQLASPMNKEVIQQKYPVLTWLPPRPLVAGINVVYSLVLTDIKGDQTPSEALQQNPPLLNLTNLINTYTTYPVTAPELKAGTKYVWQVAASYEGYSLGVTDIWVFTLKPPPPPHPEAIIYPFAAKVSDAHFYITHGIFRFAYNNKDNDKKLKYVIRRMDKKEELASLPDVDIKAGTNKIELDIRHNPGLKNNKYYNLEITDSKGQVYKLLFFYVFQP